MKFDPESGRLPELKQYQEMILAICHHGRDTDITELLSPFQKLSVGRSRIVGFCD